MTTKKELEDWVYKYLKNYHEEIVGYDIEFDKSMDRRNNMKLICSAEWRHNNYEGLCNLIKDPERTL